MDQGKLTDDDVFKRTSGRLPGPLILNSVSEEQLAEEVLRRMRVGVKAENLSLDVNEVAERLARKTVVEEAQPQDTAPVEPDLHGVVETQRASRRARCNPEVSSGVVATAPLRERLPPYSVLATLR